MVNIRIRLVGPLQAEAFFCLSLDFNVLEKDSAWIEWEFCEACIACCWDILFEPRPNGLALCLTGSVMTWIWSRTWKKPVVKREQDWVVQKFVLQWLLRHVKAIQAKPLFLPITQEGKRRRLLTWLLGQLGLNIVHNTGFIIWKLFITSRVK